MTAPSLSLSGERLTATYDLTGTAKEARRMAEDICVEQTVEFPVDLIERTDIKEQILGEIQRIDSLESHRHRAAIGFPVETAGTELTQLLNVLFGNISLKPGIRMVSIDLPESMLRRYRGPRFGANGLRQLLGARKRPLLCTAVKPMGLENTELARIAYAFAKGGVDLIKDDHGLADQVFNRFEDRVKRLTEAVNRANQETGNRCRYIPNITAPVHEVSRRAALAREHGAGGLLVAPGLVGFDTMRHLADDDAIGLPILGHPALHGSFTVHPECGISPGVLFGVLYRLAGADAAIFPHYGGRFTFTPDECRDLAEQATHPMGAIRPIFPVPAGGMTLERVAEMRQFYGDDVILLIGGDLHRHGDTLIESAARFAEAMSQ